MYIQERTMCRSQYFLKIDNNTGIPKYKQLMNAITNGIKNRTLKVGDRIPSINHISEEYGLSRSTVEKAYVHLRNQKIISSIKGKGFYVAKTELRIKKNILFLVNRITSYNLNFFNTFTDVLGEEVKIDLEIYGESPSLFKDILHKKESQYDYLVVFPRFKNNTPNNNDLTGEVLDIISELPKDKLILLDRKINRFTGQVHHIYQDFEGDFYRVMMNGLSNFKNYEKLVLVHGDDNYFPNSNELKVGLKRFCVKYGLDCDIVDKVDNNISIESKNLYLVFEESDLIQLIKKVKEKNYQLGEDVDIVSYRDTALKKYLGISVIETKFSKIASAVSEILLQETVNTVRIDFDFIKRPYN